MYTHSSITDAAPDVEPVTVKDVNNYGRIDTAADYSLIGDLITAARQQIEAMTNLCLINRTSTIYFDDWPKGRDGWDAELWLPRQPISAVDSIQYYDGDNAQQTWAASNYDTDLTARPPRVKLAYGQTWPTLRDRLRAVTVTVTAGYGSASTDVPKALRIAVMAAVVAMYEYRGAQYEGKALTDNRTIQNLIAAYRVPGVG